MPPKRRRTRSSSGVSPSDASTSDSSPPDATPSEPAAPGRAAYDPRIPEEEEDEGEELIGDDMAADYRPMGAMDEYEEDGLDATEYGLMDARARAAADAALDARDGREHASRMPAALLESDEDEEVERPRRRRREEPEVGEAPDAEAQLREAAGIDDETGLNLEDYSCPLHEWIRTPAVGEEIKKRFRRFLTTFNSAEDTETEVGQSSRYAHRIRKMCAENKESLEVHYVHLSSSVPILAIWVADAPRETFELLDEAAFEVVRIMFPDYHKIHSSIHVRVTDLPLQDSIRDLRQVHMGCLVKVVGVATRRSAVHPQLKVCKYNCTKCGYILGPFSVNGPEPKMAGTQCPSCQEKGPYTLNTEQTVYCNYQTITLQESPGTVPAGRLPRHKEVVMTWDLIDQVRPGEEIEVTGIYLTKFDSGLNRKTGFPVFSTYIEANNVQKKEVRPAARAATTAAPCPRAGATQRHGSAHSHRSHTGHRPAVVHGGGRARDRQAQRASRHPQADRQLDRAVDLRAHEHQDGDRALHVRRAGEGRQREAPHPRRHQRAAPRRPGHRQVAVPQVRREDVAARRLHDRPGRERGGPHGERAQGPGHARVDA